jgi:hypothetical protein
MAASENVIEGQPRSFVIRMLGIFAFLFGLPYLIQGLTLLLLVSPRRVGFLMFQLQPAIIALDFVIGLASLVFGVGLFLHKEWARMAWLAFLLLTLFVHLNMTVLQLLAGFSQLEALYRWIGLVILLAIISWAFLSKRTIKARFH